MTTSDKITHVMDVLFFVALLVLIYFFARADKEHDRHLASLEGTIQKLQGQVTLLEAKLVPAKRHNRLRNLAHCLSEATIFAKKNGAWVLVWRLDEHVLASGASALCLLISITLAETPQDYRFKVEKLLEGLAQPMELEIAPDGRIFINEYSGRLKIYRPDTKTSR
jgi:glucose/arabinose dehydrogenase